MATKAAFWGACLGTATSTAAFWLWTVWSKRQQEKISENDSGKVAEMTEDQVLFFPVSGAVPCRSASSDGRACQRRHCSYDHSPDHPVTVLYRSIRSAATSLDIAMYTFSLAALKDDIIAVSRKGVRVRLLFDYEQLSAGGSVVADLMREGIQARHGPCDFYFHHKFAVVDGRTVLSGSLNWTRAGIMGNYENVIVSQRRFLVVTFQDEFERLWQRFDASKP